MSADGYGGLDIVLPATKDQPARKSKVSAHRLSYMMFVGPISDDLCILHSCDTPPCFNWRHLRQGTRLDNARDRDVRHRGAKAKDLHVEGINNSQAKIADPDVLNIRRLRSAGLLLREIAEIYNLSETHISSICRGKFWSHVS
jgi:hypothetical protein